MMNNVRLFSRVLVLGNSSTSTRDNRYNCALPTRGILEARKEELKEREKEGRKEGTNEI